MPEHGTYARYQRERRDGEQPCDACRNAYRAYQREWRTRPNARAAQRADSRARGRALHRLARMHASDFLRLLDEERAINETRSER